MTWGIMHRMLASLNKLLLNTMIKPVRYVKGNPNQHTNVKFIRERIPCKCLDEKYNQVKSIKKMGHCGSVNCISSNRVVERKTMLYCVNCRQINYCCRECQVADWSRHKPMCKQVSKMKDEFKSSQR